MTSAPWSRLLPGEFLYEFSALKSTTRYAARSGDVASEEYVLTVTDRPLVRLLRLALTFPSYTRLPERELEDNAGDVTALKGTRITFWVEANKDLEEATMVFSDSSRLPMSVNGPKASASTVLMKDRTYHLMLKDTRGGAERRADRIHHAYRPRCLSDSLCPDARDEP